MKPATPPHMLYGDGSIKTVYDRNSLIWATQVVEWENRLIDAWKGADLRKARECQGMTYLEVIQRFPEFDLTVLKLAIAETKDDPARYLDIDGSQWLVLCRTIRMPDDDVALAHRVVQFFKAASISERRARQW